MKPFANLKSEDTAKPPQLAITVNGVLDEFHALDGEWCAVGTVQARIIGGPTYRWTLWGEKRTKVLGIVCLEGVGIRKATDKEYAELEIALSRGKVTIELLNRVTRQNVLLHQATGETMAMG